MEGKNWIKRLDWGHLLLLIAIATGIALYLADAIQASTRVGNLVLILPASILGLLLCLVNIAGVFKDARNRPVNTIESEPDKPTEPDESLFERGRPAIMLALFGIYIFLIPRAGMDGASALFLAAALLVNGERRPWFIVAYSVIFAAAATWFFKSILPYPLYTIFI